MNPDRGRERRGREGTEAGTAVMSTSSHCGAQPRWGAWGAGSVSDVPFSPPLASNPNHVPGPFPAALSSADGPAKAPALFS